MMLLTAPLFLLSIGTTTWFFEPSVFFTNVAYMPSGLDIFTGEAHWYECAAPKGVNGGTR
jgi:hypothetical protein